MTDMDVSPPVVLPGDSAEMLDAADGPIRLGNGLRVVAGGSDGGGGGGGGGGPVQIIPTKAGVLHREADERQQGERYFVQNQQKRYIPTVDDSVLGVVIDKHGDTYKLNLGSAAPATLSAIAFEGASRRNRPHLEVCRRRRATSSTAIALPLPHSPALS